MNLHRPIEHPLKQKVRQARLRLYELAPVLGVSESKLSRTLSGIQEMPKDMEKTLKEVLSEVAEYRG